MTTTGPGTARPDPTGTTTRDHDHPGGTAGIPDGIGDGVTAVAGRGPDAPGAAAWDLPAEARAASRARDLTDLTLRHWHVTDPSAAGDVVLMVDELVTNAVVHGAGPVRLALRLDGTLLTAEVSDAHPAAPAVPGGPPRVLDWAEAGRGLLLVAALATEFGARPRPPGKTVWFTRNLTSANPEPAVIEPAFPAVADSRAAHSRAAESSAEDSGAEESGAEESGAENSEAAGSEAAGSGTAGSGTELGGEGRAGSDAAEPGVAVPAPRRPEPGRAPAR